MPKLSIIVPVYNVEPYIRRCLDSILSQTFKDFEVIIVDDGSPDNCGNIIDEYAQNDDRIIAIHQQNKGVSSARNAGLRIARGEYIGFVDPDDWIDYLMYEKLINIIQNTGSDVACCGWFEGERQLIVPDLYMMDREQYLLQIWSIPISIADSICNKVFKSKILENTYLKECISQGEDYDFLYQSSFNVNRVVYLDEPLYYVEQRSGSATRNGTINRAQAMKVRADLLEIIQGKEKKSLLFSAQYSFYDLCIRFDNSIKDEEKDKVLAHKNSGIIRRIMRLYTIKHINSFINNNKLSWKQKLMIAYRSFIGL